MRLAAVVPAARAAGVLSQLALHGRGRLNWRYRSNRCFAFRLGVENVFPARFVSHLQSFVRVNKSAWSHFGRALEVEGVLQNYNGGNLINYRT